MTRFNIGDRVRYTQNGDPAGVVTHITHDMVTVEYKHIIRHNGQIVEESIHSSTIHVGFLELIDND